MMLRFLKSEKAETLLRICVSICVNETSAKLYYMHLLQDRVMKLIAP